MRFTEGSGGPRRRPDPPAPPRPPRPRSLARREDRVDTTRPWLRPHRPNPRTPLQHARPGGSAPSRSGRARGRAGASPPERTHPGRPHRGTHAGAPLVDTLPEGLWDPPALTLVGAI